jgi:cytochrome c-type biogenesis protein CcmH
VSRLETPFWEHSESIEVPGLGKGPNGRRDLSLSFGLPFGYARLVQRTAGISPAIRVFLFVVSVIFFMGALAGLVPVAHAQETARAKELGQKLMCACGCNQILTACNHVGCTYSHNMIKQLDDRVARGDSDDLILQAFVQEYGLKVLSEPSTKGFNGLAWVIPVVVPLLAVFLVWQLVRRWRLRAVLTPAGGPAMSPELLARVQHEANRESDE